MNIKSNKAQNTIKLLLIFNIAIVLLVTLSSCSQVNTDSQDHYMEKNKMRHGIIPITDHKVDPVHEKLNVGSFNRGKKLYKSHCINCHGSKGFGNGPLADSLVPKPKNLNKLSKEVLNFRFFMMVSQYSNKMPGWKTIFSKEDLKDLEHYIRYISTDFQ